MRLCNSAAHRQSEASAPSARLVTTRKRLEELCLLRRADARATVLDADQQFRLLRVAISADIRVDIGAEFNAIRAVPQGVVQQIADELCQQHRVGLHQRQVGRHARLDASARVALAHPGQHRAYDFFHRFPIALQHRRTLRLCAGQAHELQGVFGNGGEVIRFADDAVQQAVLLGHAQLVALRLQRGCRADHHGQRSAQVV